MCKLATDIASRSIEKVMTHTEQSSNATVSIADCGQMFKEVSMLEYMHYKRLEKNTKWYVFMGSCRTDHLSKSSGVHGERVSRIGPWSVGPFLCSSWLTLGVLNNSEL